MVDIQIFYRMVHCPWNNKSNQAIFILQMTVFLVGFAQLIYRKFWKHWLDIEFEYWRIILHIKHSQIRVEIFHPKGESCLTKCHFKQKEWKR